MYLNKFVLSIIHNNHPIKEFGTAGNKRVALPFDSEYKIRLKNKNDRSCTARVFVDNKRASVLGDLIISSGSTVNLERFIDSSLEHGKGFKFVSLDHPDVDDPTSSENGVIKVEFRLARKENGIKINIPPVQWEDWYKDWDDTYKPSYNGGYWNVYDGSNNGPMRASFSSNSSINFVAADLSNIEDGATVEGNHSNQSFVYSNLDVEDFPTTVLQLKIVGIKDSKQADKFLYKYCSNCGARVKKNAKYCSECGRKL